jgi:hypothetical protein
MKITPQELLDAYDATGIGSCFGEFCNDKGDKGCALSALYLSARDTQINNRDRTIFSLIVHQWAHVRYGLEFATGFISGFDNSKFNSKSTSKEHVEGWCNGQILRLAVLQGYWKEKETDETRELGHP